MNEQERKDVTLAYVEALNRHDMNALSDIITFDHKFVDLDGEVRRNRTSVMSGWEAFFRMSPTYGVHIWDILSADDSVLLTGRATSKDNSMTRSEEFDRKLLFRSKVRGGKVAEWVVMKDTPNNRRKLRD